MAEKAFITPDVLRWARETARIPVEIAASKISVEHEKLVEWESGKSYPSIRQAEMLAKAYRRPFALLFLPDIPYDFTPLQDFRKPSSVPLGTASLFIIREIQQKQAWLRELSEENREEKLSFVGKYSIQSNPVEVANDILATLGITPANYQSTNPIKKWIKKAEEKGIFISRTSFINSHLLIDSNELQGFCISDPFCPFIFVNSEDWTAPQLFTLVHELAHIWIAETGISNEIESGIIDEKKIHPVELFCNKVAAHALMPEVEMGKVENAVFNSYELVFKTSRQFGISSYAFLIHAKNLGRINNQQYQILSSQADVQFKNFLKKEEEKKMRQKEQEGGPNYYQLLVNKNSTLFTQVVLDAWRGGTIEPTQACWLLNTQVNNFHKLETFMNT